MQNFLSKTTLQLLISGVFFLSIKSMNAQNKILKQNESIIATYEKGKAKSKIQSPAKLKNKKLNYVIIYNSDATWANTFNTGDITKTGDPKFNQLIKKYDLTITRLFELDEDSEALILEYNNSPKKIIACAKKLSTIDHVLTLHLKTIL